MGSLNRIGLSWFHYGMYVTMMRKEWDWYGFLITDGDGNDGDVYNSPQMMLCIDGAILNNGGYINNATTVAAYGDATAYPYAQQCLHNVIRYAMYQYAGPHGKDEEGNAVTTTVATTSGSGSGVPTGAIVVGGVAAAAVIAGALAAVKKKRAASEEDEEEEGEQDES